jgi:hypothetical protein
MLGLDLINLQLEFLNLLIKVFSHSLLMVAETSDLPVAIIVELNTFVNRHSWDSGGINAMLVFFKELV